MWELYFPTDFSVNLKLLQEVVYSLNKDKGDSVKIRQSKFNQCKALNQPKIN